MLCSFLDNAFLYMLDCYGLDAPYLASDVYAMLYCVFGSSYAHLQQQCVEIGPDNGLNLILCGRSLWQFGFEHFTYDCHLFNAYQMRALYLMSGMLYVHIYMYASSLVFFYMALEKDFGCFKTKSFISCKIVSSVCMHKKIYL